MFSSRTDSFWNRAFIIFLVLITVFLVFILFVSSTVHYSSIFPYFLVCFVAWWYDNREVSLQIGTMGKLSTHMPTLPSSIIW